MSLNRFAFRFALVGALFSTFALGATYEGTTVTKALERNGKDLKGEARQSFSLTSEIYRVTSELKLVPEVVWDCEGDVPADGTRGDWKGFFNAKKEDKPAALAAAIKGVGISTARKLVEDGYFDSKPRSWTEFARRIEDADGEYQSGFSYEVLVTHKKENMINLGYLVEGQCKFKTEYVWRRVPRKDFHRNETRRYELRLSGAPLLLGERETFTVSFDGFDSSIHVSSAYNTYRVERWDNNGVVVFDLVGTRKQVRPANNLNLSATATGGSLQIQVSDTAFDAELAAQEDRYVVVNVQIDKSGWRSNQDLATFEKPLSKTSSVTDLTDLGVQVPAGANLVLHYELRVSGSRYYNGEKSPSKKLKLRLN